MGNRLGGQIKLADLDGEQTVRVLPLTLLSINENKPSSVVSTVIASSTLLTISIDISRSTRDGGV